MKQVYTVFFFFLFSHVAFSQTDCDDLQKGLCCGNEAHIIPALEDISCHNEKAFLYKMFPKLTSYGGFLFNQINSCNVKELDSAPTALEFEYCVAGTRKKMKVTITDVKNVFYTTDLGKSLKDIITLPFDNISPILGTYSSNSKVFSKAFISMPRPTNESGNYAGFDALYQNQYWIHIVIDNQPQFKMPKDVDVFIEEYNKAFTL